MPFEQLALAVGYDHNYVINGEPGTLRLAGELVSEENHLAMNTYTTMPGIQLYSGNYLSGHGKGGFEYKKYGALCLETQHFPDAVNRPNFPSPILRAGEVYRQTSVYEFKNI